MRLPAVRQRQGSEHMSLHAVMGSVRGQGPMQVTPRPLAIHPRHRHRMCASRCSRHAVHVGGATTTPPTWTARHSGSGGGT
jgi:hypothetical protein